MLRTFDNKYKYIKDLGGGGFGLVFLAKENISGELRAIKKLKTSKGEQQDLIHEIQQVAKLKLPNTVTYHHHFWENEELYFVMEYCPNGSLHFKLRHENPSPETIVDWIRELALSLAEIHSQGIVHKDIKPLNILFSETNKPKISDFGMANRFGGTVSYMSPRALAGQERAVIDPREDIYALGVTLMEALTGTNPFHQKQIPEILLLHQKIAFPISNLPFWQQSIILKAIHPIPELRFQTMLEFAEAIEARQVPFVFRKQVLEAGILSSKIRNLIQFKKWSKAIALVEYAVKKYPDNLNVLEAAGNLYLSRGKIESARFLFEKALKVNPRLNIQKELGEIQLELHNYPAAISLISDHLHRNSNDLNAQNLLLKCFYLSGRYEAGISLAEELLKVFPQTSFLINNRFICEVLLDLELNRKNKSYTKPSGNAFLAYNWDLVNEPDSLKSHNGLSKPYLKSKLLFMESRFESVDQRKSHRPELSILDSNILGLAQESFFDAIIKIGRNGYEYNDIFMGNENKISRRHAVIINQKNDCWIYDLDSFTGTMVNGESVYQKMPLIGVSIINIGDNWFRITQDRGKLF